MLFSSTIFCFLFLPLTILFFYSINNQKLNFRIFCIIIISFIFYSYYNPALILLIFVSILINYFFAHLLLKKSKYIFLLLIIILNLSLLFYFKYSYFFISEILTITHRSNFNLYWEYALPLGISFFTFQQISYQVSIYKNEISHNNFLHYFAYVSFFPQLIAGPIVKHNHFFYQVRNKNFLKIKKKNLEIGLSIFSIGIFKKIILADSLAHYVDLTYNSCLDINCSQSDYFLTTILYSFQIYFDFSAYSDMAIGIAKILGVDLPYNFNSPYKGKSLIQFWRNWHITLSNFLKDHIYIPLGGSKGKNFTKYSNLIITMVIGGVWHGAGFNFIIWGLIHGIGLSINHFHTSKKIFNFNKYISVIFTFIFVSLSWIFFKSKDLNSAFLYINKLLVYSNSDSYIYRFDNIQYWLPLSILSFVIIFYMPNSNKFLEKYIIKFWFLKYLISSLLIFSLLNLNRAKEFIYYEF